MNLAPFIETAHIMADAAGLLIRDAWIRVATTTFKPDGSPVTLADMQAVHEGITEEVFTVLGVENSVNSRTSYGGTAPEQVRAQIARWKARI